MVPEKLLTPLLQHWHKTVSWWPAPGKVAWIYTVCTSTLLVRMLTLMRCVLSSSMSSARSY